MRSTTELLADLVRQSQQLLRVELSLVRAELGEAGGLIATSLAALAVGLSLSLPAAAQERIIDFSSDITVAPTGTLTVRETITVLSENDAIVHGIFRDFPTTNIAFSSQSAVAAAYTIVVALKINNGVNTFRVTNDYSSLSKGSTIKNTVLYE